MRLENKVELLKENIFKMDNITIAFSGGVDSSFLLKIASDVLNEKVLAITVRTLFFPERECYEAIEFVQKYNIRHEIIDFDIINFEEIISNTPDRCYKCKSKIFEEIKRESMKQNIIYVADGSNIDDLSDYRPGMKALKELEIISPLQDVALSKEEIRTLSSQIGLKTYDKPSFACLASRFPYGQKITKENLLMVDRAEQFLLDIGFKQIRVRHHGDIARIEVAPEERRKFYKDEVLDKVYNKFKGIGFRYTTMDLKGYRTGSLNESLIN